ncbi:MAG: hypothetical protein JJT85_13235 [Chromatiales bacterium]|nr:hypothetical protein [Chromatiales bacterium]TVS10300.1 MAG: hypothetical protein EA417_19150 [Gammaproteobacteria bacterium]
MTLDTALKTAAGHKPPALPELRYLSAAVKKVRDRWPTVVPQTNASDREKLARLLRETIEQDNWRDVRLAFVLSAARAVFDRERNARPDLAETRAFLVAELDVSTSKTFLSGMLAIHIESFEPGAEHTRVLSKTLSRAVGRMAPSDRSLLGQLPELLKPTDGPRRLAIRMAKMSAPYRELSAVGLRTPHSNGFMDHAHLEVTKLVAPSLTDLERVEWFVNWLRPPGQNARHTGAARAIEALVFPWIKAPPPDELRSYLVETLVEMYGDPRIRSNDVWNAVSNDYMDVVHRWLTRADMRFFTGVVDAAQSDNMWRPRRDFWLRLYEEGLIEQAWVAFSTEALNYARRHLIRQEASNTEDRFGWQCARQNTSLLIMKVGNKIMVDGCHSYKTHVFDAKDPMAPRLFQGGYDCEEIRLASRESKAHHSIELWSRWVRDMINADVPYSLRKRPYSRIRAPRRRPERFGGR